VVIYEVRSLEGEYAERFKIHQVEYVGIIKKVITEIIKDTRYKMDINVATFCLMGMLNWIVQWYKPEGRVPPESLARDICAFFISGLKGT
jgi:hypothetical protein